MTLKPNAARAEDAVILNSKPPARYGGKASKALADARCKFGSARNVRSADICGFIRYQPVSVRFQCVRRQRRQVLGSVGPSVPAAKRWGVRLKVQFSSRSLTAPEGTSHRMRQRQRHPNPDTPRKAAALALRQRGSPALEALPPRRYAACAALLPVRCREPRASAPLRSHIACSAHIAACECDGLRRCCSRCPSSSTTHAQTLQRATRPPEATTAAPKRCKTAAPARGAARGRWRRY